MRGAKDGPNATGSVSAQPAIQDEGTRTSGSSTQATNPELTSMQPISEPTQPGAAGHFAPGFSPRTTPVPNSGLYQDVLVDCNALVEEYRKGKVSKATVYVEIQSKLANVLGNDRARSDAAFESFIATIESHDSEVEMAARRAAAGNSRHLSASPAGSDIDGQQSDEEPTSKRTKVNESAYAWVSGRKNKRITLSASLSKTLKLIDTYTADPKAAKRSLVNEPDCPEFPDSEWKNIISGRAVNLDAVLSGQLSTTNDEVKIEKFGDFEVSFGAVEPTKIVKNGGDWTIAWNRTVRATVFAFPHRLQELTSYGEYIVNLFSVTHPSVHARVIAFDKAVRKRVGSVRNLELSEYEKFADLKIAHMDSIGVSVYSGSSKGDINVARKGKRSRSWKKSEPCNKWNEGTCSQAEEDCRRQHVCNKCGRSGHRGKECRKPA
jgi:hypothetical protein